MSTLSTPPKKRRLLTIAVILLVTGAGIAAFVHHWKEQSKVSQCIINLRNCEGCINGIMCMSNLPTETWRNPDAVDEMLKEHLSESSLTCPDGGTYSLVYDQDNPNLPRMVCSKEESHGHVGPNH